MESHTLGAADTIGPGGGYLYESPLWDHRRNVLLWVDIEAGRVHELDPASGAHEHHDLGQPVACIALRASGGYVVALAQSVVAVNERFDVTETVVDQFNFAPDVRFNDGCVGPGGLFWVGTLSHLRPGAGVLFQIDGERRAQVALDRVSISNGIDWAADGRMYYVDSGAHRVDQLTTPEVVDEAESQVGTGGAIRVLAREPFFDLPSPEAPDGLCVDAEDHVWVASWGGSRVIRLAPSGDVVGELRLPAPHVSSVAFGGPHLRDLYITTAREELDAATIAALPLSGSVFRWRAPVAGRPARMWAG